MIRFGPWSLLLAFGALTGATVAVALLFARRNREANRILAALLAVVSLRLVPYIIGYAGFYDRFPWLSFAPFDLPLALGPLLWLHVARLGRGTLPAGWRRHLLPAAVHLTAWTLLFALPSVEQKTAIVIAVIDPWVQPLIDAGALGGLLVYGAMALRERRAYQRWLDDHLSNREEFRLTGLGVLLVAMAVLTLGWLVMAILDAWVTPLDYYDQFPFQLLQSAVAWAIGLVALRGTALTYPDPQAAAGTAGDAGATAAAPPAQDWQRLGTEWRDRMVAEGWWRDPQLTLGGMARRLATNTTYLSRALNVGLGQSFNECVNRQRVLAVQRALDAGNPSDLVQLGFDAGFNSKASFQRAFVRYAGETPSAYRARTSQNR